MATIGRGIGCGLGQCCKYAVQLGVACHERMLDGEEQQECRVVADLQGKRVRACWSFLANATGHEVQAVGEKAGQGGDVVGCIMNPGENDEQCVVGKQIGPHCKYRENYRHFCTEP